MGRKPAYKTSGKELEAIARAGIDADAILALAVLVKNGWRDLEEDEDRALALEKQAAATGHPRALRMIGDRYHRGDVVDEDQREAIAWWRKAAEAGDVNAMANLHGALRETHPTESNKWLALAAAHGQPYAAHTLKTLPTNEARLTLSQFANLSLEEMAANIESTANELSWELEEVKASLQQINDVVGSWIERLAGSLRDVRAVTSIDGDDVDFPAPTTDELPSGITEDNTTIEVMLYTSRLHLQLDLTLWDEGWSFTLSSYEPHPAKPEQTWLVQQLVDVMRDLKLATKR